MLFGDDTLSLIDLFIDSLVTTFRCLLKWRLEGHMVPVTKGLG